MTDRNRIDVADGKYAVVGIEDGHLRALRHGEEWRSLTGDNLILALAQELQEARERLRGDTGWEYGNALISKHGYPTGLVMPAREGEAGGWGLRIVRRRKAGPWEACGE